MHQKERRELIMDYYLNPRLKRELNDNYETYYSSRCADELKVEVKYQDTKIAKTFWDGQGCAIFVASTEIFLEKIKNTSKNEIKKVLNEYSNMLNGKKFDKKIVDKLIIFENVKKQYNRLSCASMICDFFKKEL